jgi:hypothetical protein
MELLATAFTEMRMDSSGFAVLGNVKVTSKCVSVKVFVTVSALLGTTSLDEMRSNKTANKTKYPFLKTFPSKVLPKAYINISRRKRPLE